MLRRARALSLAVNHWVKKFERTKNSPPVNSARALVRPLRSNQGLFGRDRALPCDRISRFDINLRVGRHLEHDGVKKFERTKNRPLVNSAPALARHCSDVFDAFATDMVPSCQAVR